MKKISNLELFMMLSNAFIVVPAIYAIIYREWIYFFLVCAVVILSPSFHWLRIEDRGSYEFKVFRFMDWLFAGATLIYMYIYVLLHTNGSMMVLLIGLLSSLLLFFFYGLKYGNYEKLHPWAHFFASVIATIILIIVN